MEDSWCRKNTRTRCFSGATPKNACLSQIVFFPPLGGHVHALPDTNKVASTNAKMKSVGRIEAEHQGVTEGGKKEEEADTKDPYGDLAGRSASHFRAPQGNVLRFDGS